MKDAIFQNIQNRNSGLFPVRNTLHLAKSNPSRQRGSGTIKLS